MNGYLCENEHCKIAVFPDDLAGWLKVFFHTVEATGFVETPSYFCSTKCLQRYVKENQ